MNLRSPVSARRLVLSLALTLLALLGGTAPALAQGPSIRAGLIVEYGNGDVDALCIDLDGEGVTGVDLLQASGLAVGMQSSGLGMQICQIGDVGCEPGREACWCRCLSNPCSYWTYFQWKDGAWSYAPLGASRRQVTDGDVDAWVWGDGKTLPVSSPDLACAPEAPADAATAEPAVAATAGPSTAATSAPSAAGASAAASTAPPEAPASRTGFGCSGPALMLLPLAALAFVAYWRR